MKFSSRFDAVGFFSNIIAVILGIAITFFVQGIIDRHNIQKNVDSALLLVREELSGSKADLESCADFLDGERMAAQYLQRNLDHLHSCPTDSVSIYGSTYILEMLLTLPQDALELLKTSSLFSSIGDNGLSLKIIRAYDQCDALLEIFNRHEKLKSTTLRDVMIEKGMDKILNPDGTVSLTEIMNTNKGEYLTTLLLGGAASSLRAGFEDIDNAIASIDEYLAR